MYEQQNLIESHFYIEIQIFFTCWK